MKRHTWLGAVILPILTVVMALSASRHHSITFDELPHLTAGVTYWMTNDYRLNAEQGVLTQRLIGLPVWLAAKHLPDLHHPDWATANSLNIGHDFLFRGVRHAELLAWCGRSVLALVGGLLTLVVFLWTRRLFGIRAGVCAALLCAFCPTTLAHAGLATSDLMVATTILCAVAAVWMLLHKVTTAHVLCAGLSLAVALTSKLSALLLVPIILGLLIIRLLQGRPLLLGSRRRRRVLVSVGGQTIWCAAALGAASLVAWLLLWGLYGFQFSTPHLIMTWDRLLDAPTTVRRAVAFCRETRLLPEAFLFGVAYLDKFTQGRPAFLNGHYSQTGWWYFFPYAALVKTTPGLLFLCVCAAWAGLRRRGPRRWRLARRAYTLVPLLVLLVVFWFSAVTSHINIGHRHLLPTYPVMFILAGGAAGAWMWRQRWTRTLALLALASVVVSSLLARPQYLAYFNVIAGGPTHGYRHLVDSSLDWGQDLPGLARWLAHENGSLDHAPDPVYLSYFGSADPAYYGITAQSLPGPFPVFRSEPPVPLKGGTYCISATMLQTIYLRVPPPWTADHERAYQKQQAELDRHHQLAQTPAGQALLAQSPPGYWTNVFTRYEELRLARLCAFLRQREPDDQVGYSILIYRLKGADVSRSQFGAPPPE